MPTKKYSIKIRRRWKGTSSVSTKSSKAVSNRSRIKSLNVRNTKGALRGLARIPTCKIPKSKLDAAIKILDADVNIYATQKSETRCHIPPGTSCVRNWGFKKLSFPRLLGECRVCLLNQDWTNLAAILAVAKPLRIRDYHLYMPYFHKYAAICLLHSGEEENLDSFLCSVIGCQTEHDKQIFLKNLTTFFEKEINNKRSKKAETNSKEASKESKWVAVG
ncbi:unnamed protein product [Hermetia illucens]|uniref:Uncharacterized protein n=1 Tax=Hermetia illucens TaxID=343691 RepID=A0A7R8UEL9_HERIL|nr:uncharacterized protein LOC119659479 [Hermetia illucens]CAD7079255.1 unnamed protein product [Hermetia illucens]